MQPFIPWDEFIRERQTRHKTSLLQPEDSTKAVQNKETWTEDHFKAGTTSENSNKQATQKTHPTLHDPLPAVLEFQSRAVPSREENTLYTGKGQDPFCEGLRAVKNKQKRKLAN